MGKYSPRLGPALVSALVPGFLLLALPGVVSAPALAAEKTPAQELVDTAKARIQGNAPDTPFLFSDYPAKPAQNVLSAADHAAYRTALANRDCGPAATLILNAYLERYPAIAEALRDPNVRAYWDVEVLKPVYPEVSFCLVRKRLAEALEILARRDEPPALFRRFADDRHVQSAAGRVRLNTLDEIAQLADLDYPPAMRFYLQQETAEGRVKIDPEERLFYLYRLHFLGSELDEHEARVRKAEAEVEPWRRRLMECAAERSSFHTHRKVMLECIRTISR